MIKVLVLFSIFLAAGVASAEPSNGWLTGEEDDFLQYTCTAQSDGNIECDFTQITMYLKQKPEEIEDLIEERLPGLVEQFQQEDMGEVCEYMFPLQSLMEALMRGDEDAAKTFLEKMPDKMRKEFDFAEAADKVSRLDNHEAQDMQASISVISKMCDDPKQSDFEAMLRFELEKNARTCELRVNKWTGQFRPISAKIWALRTEGPEGQCGVQRLDRFECGDDAYLCEFISEQRILNSDAEPIPGIPCRDLEERAFRYEHDSDGVYLNCEIVSFF